MSSTTSVRGRGFTLIEVMIVIAIVSVLAALAIVGVRSYLATAKTAEAKQIVGAITRTAIAQYERERDVSQILAATGVVSANTHLLCTSATPVPLTFTAVEGTKYQPSNAPGVDFNSGSTLEGWQCLGFSISQPIYFQYSYQVGGSYVSQGLPGAPLPTGDGFEVGAVGDLKADGQRCTITRIGEVRDGEIATSTTIYTNIDSD
ncbi:MULTISPECIES: type IV pilin protein [Sorangium]|uniref:Pilin n=1 Tax=Sorangium cellulosum (strain So ce56) TaxID=448385 RepID=A9F205_SORC5|nr:type II secretion system protein [Sorangium cellulosum]CAN94438.1 pilin [Sorangium cellulosum So ce56]